MSPLAVFGLAAVTRGDAGVDATLQLSHQTWVSLADRPRERRLVCAVWDRLEELGNHGGHDKRMVAALRFVLVHHQPVGGRCRACRRRGARSLWRRRSWPCVVWRQVHYELIGPFGGGGHHRRDDD